MAKKIVNKEENTLEIDLRKKATFSKFQDVTLQAFKADGKLYRQWSDAKLIEETSEHFLLAFAKTRVLEPNGKSWTFDRFSIGFFSKKHLFNAIIRFEEERPVTLYCNLASVTIRDRNILKFIDYELDIKLNYGVSYRVVDWHDFEKNSRLYNYDQALIEAIYQELEYIERIYHNHDYIFNTHLLIDYYRHCKYLGIFSRAS